MPLFTCLLSFVSLSGWWCPALWRPLFTCFLRLSPWCPALRMFFACFHWSLTMGLSPCVSGHVKCVSQLIRFPICLQSSVCVVMSGSPVRLCVSMICLSNFGPVLHLSPKSLVAANPMSALVAVSCSRFNKGLLCFICVSCFSLVFTPFVSSCCPKTKSCSTMVLGIVSLVSHLSPTLYPSDCLRCKCRGKNRNCVA